MQKSRVQFPSVPPDNWKVAQLVEHSLDRRTVVSSSLTFPTKFIVLWFFSLMVKRLPDLQDTKVRLFQEPPNKEGPVA